MRRTKIGTIDGDQLELLLGKHVCVEILIHVCSSALFVIDPVQF